MNTEEPLLQLDFDETNIHQNRIPITNSNNINKNNDLIINFGEATNQQQQPLPLSISSSSTLESHFLSSSFQPTAAAALTYQFSDDKTLSNSSAHNPTFTRLQSPNNQLIVNENSENGNSITNSNNSPNNRKHFLDDPKSLISLTSSSSETEDIVNISEVNKVQESDIGDSSAGGGGGGGGTISGISIQHHDDTVEVNLLADSSMDSRESQPLLGIGRDTHDFVYNNFPGKFDK